MPAVPVLPASHLAKRHLHRGSAATSPATQSGHSLERGTQILRDERCLLQPPPRGPRPPAHIARYRRTAECSRSCAEQNSGPASTQVATVKLEQRAAPGPARAQRTATILPRSRSPLPASDGRTAPGHRVAAPAVQCWGAAHPSVESCPLPQPLRGSRASRSMAAFPSAASCRGSAPGTPNIAELVEERDARTRRSPQRFSRGRARLEVCCRRSRLRAVLAAARSARLPDLPGGCGARAGARRGRGRAGRGHESRRARRAHRLRSERGPEPVGAKPARGGSTGAPHRGAPHHTAATQVVGADRAGAGAATALRRAVGSRCARCAGGRRGASSGDRQPGRGAPAESLAPERGHVFGRAAQLRRRVRRH